jgi:AcrR family transcriptional regulator
MEYSDKQVQIIEASEYLFAEKGFNGTSVRDIAEKANVNLAMISYYFGSKDKLLEALFNYRGETTKLTLESLVQKTGLSSLEKVNLLIDHYIDKIMDQQCFHRIMVREQVVNNTGTTAALILAMKKRNMAIISRLIHEGQKKGEFKKNLDIPLMMTTMVGTAHNLITSKYYYKELSNLQALSDEDFHKHIRKKLSQHLKFLFKIMLTHEA